jgi:ADP-glucose type glycogen/starch synthase
MIARSRHPDLKDLEDLSPVIPSAPLRETLAGRTTRPRILYLTPEISRISPLMCPGAERLRVKSGGLADISATLLENLIRDGADIHLAIPNYRNAFRNGEPEGSASTICHVPGSRIHLAEDCAFYRRSGAYHGSPDEIRNAAIAFQREVINHIIPQVRPDIVHCNDWMTGLIPAACRKLGIKTLFSIHNIHRESTTLAEIEGKGIDATEFWDLLHYQHYPGSFGECYHRNPIDLLSSAIRNADHVSTVSPTFLEEIIQDKHGRLPPSIQWDLRVKIDSGYASGILNAPDDSYNPAQDCALAARYDHASHRQGKSVNKRKLQERVGLKVDGNAPVFLWPSRLDPVQKGCQLLTEILFRITEDYRREGLQLVTVGDGCFQRHFHDIVNGHGLRDRVAIMAFDEDLARLAYGGSDFVLMPSSYEPCGLPQMIGTRYGSLPIAHNTGGLHDTVHPLSGDLGTGDGFLFDHFDPNGLRWAIDQAMAFHRFPEHIREAAVSRIMRESSGLFSAGAMSGEYSAIYRKLAEDKSHKTTCTL